MAEEIQKNIEATKDNTDKVKAVTKAFKDQKAEVEDSIAASKANIATIEGLIDVSKLIKSTEKERLTTIGAVRDQVKGTGMSIVQGAEGFVTEMFGGPIGGIINTLSMGFLTRWMTNKKDENEASKKLKNQKKQALIDETARVEALSKVLANDEELGKLSDEDRERAIRKKLEDDKIEAATKPKAEQLEGAVAFMKGETVSPPKEVKENGGESTKEVKENGGESTPAGTGGVAALGGVADASQTGYEDIELGLWTKMEDHLFFMRSNMESAEDRRERLRKGSGGEVVSKGKAAGGPGGEDDGGGLLEWLGMTTLFGKVKTSLLGIKKLFGTGLFGKGGLFRNLKALFLKTIQSTFGKGALRALLNVAKIGSRLAGIAGVVVMPIIDGILGFFNAEDWGVSKISGVLGGVLGGGEGGIMNMFMNAGKWAVIGATIGSVVPIVGTIAGGLIGAVLGGILGLIGGDVLAQSFDKVGAWFVSVFDTVVDAISKVWHAIMPKWFTDIDFAWTDIFPTGLIKLFTGKYFTVDVPEFHWYSLFPKFLVDFFKNVSAAVEEADFKWTDLLPPFLQKFFAGTYALGKEEFEWKDLVPEFISKIAGVASTAWEKTDFTWQSLLPDFIVNMIDGIKPTGKFEWSDLLPEFINKIVSAGKAAGTTETGEFEWTRLLPTWMTSAWGVGEKMVAGEFDWKALLPDWMIGAWASTEGIIKRDVGGFDWTRLLPGFIADLFPGMKPVTINKALAAVDKFDWTMLLPDFIADIFRGKKKQLAETASLAFDWWKSLLPDWIVNVMEGKSPFAEREPVDEKVVAEKKEALDQSVASLTEMPDFSGMFNVWGTVREKINSLMNPDDVPWYMSGKVVGWMRDKLLAIMPEGQEAAAAAEKKVGAARGGFIVNRPSYLPASGTVVGEHGTFTGKGAARGAINSPIPMDGGPEAVIPLTGNRAQGFIQPIAASIAGQVMNNLAMERVGMEGSTGMGSAPTVIDNSSQPIITNNTIINSPEPQGPMLPGAGRDHAVSHFRHVA